MNWQKEKILFSNFIIENDIIGLFKKPIRLKSGRLSHWYINWRNVSEDVYLIDKLTDYIISFVESIGIKPDCFYGVPEGATKFGIITQYKWAKKQPNFDKGKYTLAMGRGKCKEHGDPKDKYYLGVPNGKVVVLEDTLTTGDSLIEAINGISALKIEIIAAIGLTNRNEMRDDGRSVEEVLQEKGIQFFTMSNAIELLPILYSKIKPNVEIARNIERYFEKYGTSKLKLL